MEGEVFDVGREFALELPDGRRVAVRHPSDEEWCERSRRLLFVQRGPVEKTVAIGKEAADLDLFRRIHRDGLPLTDAEAVYCVCNLEPEIVGSQRKGRRVTVRMRALGFDLAHVMRLDHAALAGWRAEVLRPSGAGGRAEFDLRLEPSGPVYDALLVSCEGYAASIPILHKHEVLIEMFNYWRSHG